MNTLRAGALLLLSLFAGVTDASDADASGKPTLSQGRGFDERSGESVYRAICQGCHMPDGQGAQGAGAYPALARDPRLVAAAYPIVTVLNGRRAMPSFAQGLDDVQVAAVVGYVRTHFGNSYDDAITVDQVAAIRAVQRGAPRGAADE